MLSAFKVLIFCPEYSVRKTVQVIFGFSDTGKDKTPSPSFFFEHCERNGNGWKENGRINQFLFILHYSVNAECCFPFIQLNDSISIKIITKQQKNKYYGKWKRNYELLLTVDIVFYEN